MRVLLVYLQLLDNEPMGLMYVVVSSELMDSKPTQRGLTVFKTLEDFTKIIPTDTNLRFKFIHIQNADAGWKDIVYAGRKIQ